MIVTPIGAFFLGMLVGYVLFRLTLKKILSRHEAVVVIGRLPDILPNKTK